MSQQPWSGQRPVYGRPGAAAWTPGPPAYPQGSPNPGFGQRPFGQPPFGQPPFGQRPFGQRPFGQPPFGQPSFGPPMPQYVPGPVAPPRRRSPLRALLLAAILVGVAILVGLVVAGLSAQSSSTSAPYQNDDYQVPPPDTSPPPIPLPDTYDEAKQWLTDNRFYAQVVPSPVRCKSQPVNVTSASDEQLDAHFEGLMECLVRVWQPPVSQAGFVIPRPTVTIYGESITTKCGSSDVNAFYCAADQQVYYSNLLPQVLTEARNNKWTADVVMAHEFGHALQARTGLLISARALGQQSGDQSVDLAYSRRLETQADCFSGMFIRAVSTSLGVPNDDVDGILQIYVEIGDDTLSGDPQVVGNHGLARSRRYWGNTGLSTSQVGACNTFVAPPSAVR